MLHIGKNNPKHNYHMNGRILEKIDFENDLGVLMDTEIKFHQQTSSAVKKTNLRTNQEDIRGKKRREYTTPI